MGAGMIASITITDTVTGESVTSGIISIECGLLDEHEKCDHGDGFICCCACHKRHSCYQGPLCKTGNVRFGCDHLSCAQVRSAPCVICVADAA